MRNKLPSTNGPKRTSGRIAKRQEDEMQRLFGAAYGQKRRAIQGDITHLLHLPLEIGKDGRGYTSRKARTQINNKISSTRKIYSRKEDLPDIPKMLEKKATEKKSKHFRFSDRNSNTNFKVGSDVTYVEYTGADFAGTRMPSDTPRPRSPRPEDTGEALPVPNMRYEQTHQAAYSFTGEPGHTIHAPTQANQVADCHMEALIRGTPGAFIAREDTYERSTIWAIRPVEEGYEGYTVSYMRRNVSDDASQDAEADDA
ncbi:hypothetical protein [Xanthomonas euvesicatoria]|uniref:hypothetical protein n=1 Tax=Xanthomonas euvesicatoria TaxID=456327 RepID=UPI00160F8A23|nr:hypothetical protein [Xanthomonas euvesicatoria]MBB4870840.1 hypothetical protein [Xanthomonas euvesicatoria]